MASIIEEKITALESRINSIDKLLRAALQTREGESIHNTTSNLVATEYEKIQYIMKHFDFEKIQSVMSYLDWKQVNTLYGVPTVDELKKEAKRLLVEAVCGKSTISSGGLRAVYIADDADDQDPYIGLEFIAEDCEGFKKEDDLDYYLSDENER